MPIDEDSGLEHIPKNEIVEQFRYDIFYWFQRFQNFYDRANAATRGYRLDYVALVTRVYTSLVSVLGDDIEGVRQLTYEYFEIIQERSAELGPNNACLTRVATQHGEISLAISSHIRSCALYANTTMAGLLENTFYPTFANIKDILATVPVATIDVLSRGNVLQDERAMIEYLRARYEIIELQWLGAVSQLLRWEANRFEVDGLFLVDQTTLCLADALIEFIIDMARLQTEVRACT